MNKVEFEWAMNVGSAELGEAGREELIQDRRNICYLVCVS